MTLHFIEFHSHSFILQISSTITWWNKEHTDNVSGCLAEFYCLQTRQPKKQFNLKFKRLDSKLFILLNYSGT